MREIYKAGVTPQQKLVAVNNKFGNSGIKSQQGTSRIIYDTLEATTTTTVFRFFEDSASRSFPFTNTGSDGNKLGVGDTMVVESVIFSFLQIDNATGELVGNQGLAGYLPAGLGIFDFDIANNKVIKKVTLTESQGFYSKKTNSNRVGDLELETQIVIPPLLPYVLELRLPRSLSQIIPPPVANATCYVQCQIIGSGGIIAPRTTF
jgi:hypothetical protein